MTAIVDFFSTFFAIIGAAIGAVVSQWWFWVAAAVFVAAMLAVMYRPSRRAGSNDQDPGHRKGQS